MSKIGDYFSFSRTEKRGAFVLFLIIIILVIAQPFIRDLKKNEQTDFSEFEEAINEFENSKKANYSSTVEKAIEPVLFEFNPNTLIDEDWIKLGFKEWQVKAINKYKSKGGSWKTKSDVAKIYGLDSAKYEQLKPYILLPESINSKKESTPPTTYFTFNPNTISSKEWEKLGFEKWQIKAIEKYKSKGGNWKTKKDVSKIYGLTKEEFSKLEPYIDLPEKLLNSNSSSSKKNYNIIVNVNTASIKDLTKLKGIYSEKYAAIIFKYRNNLGGFIKKEQLLEVWNMTEETYKGFVNQIDLGNANPKKININTSTIDDLKKHPYIDWKTANAIIKYRKANGNFKSVWSIKKIYTISDDLYQKISPYLKI